MQVADLYAGLSLRADKSSFEKGDKMLESIKTGLEVLAVAEIANGIREIFNGVSETAIAASRMAQKIGISTEAVQELGYAASTTGVSTEELQIGFTKMAKGLEEFRTKGTGPVGEALVALKVPLKEIQTDSPDQLLSTLADKFAAMPDGIHKTAMAVEVFGRSGANLIPLLNKGGDGIAELRTEAEDLGVVVDGKTTEAFKGLEESTLRIHGAMTGFKNTLAVALLPTISGIADNLFAWIKANKELIASGIKTFVDGLVTAFHFVVDTIDLVIDGVHAIEDVFTAAFDGDEGAQALLIGVGAVIAAVVLPLLVSWGISMLSIAASTLLAIAPFVLIAAAVAAVAYGVIKLVKNWDKVKAAVASVASAIKDGISAAFSFIADLPVIKQLLWLASKLADLTGLKDHFDTSHEKATEDSVTMSKDEFAKAHPEIVKGAKSKWDDPDQVAIRNMYNSPATVNPSNSTATTQNQITNNITLNSTNADPKAVATEFRAQIGEHFDRVLRDTHAATGGADQ